MSTGVIIPAGALWTKSIMCFGGYTYTAWISALLIQDKKVISGPQTKNKQERLPRFFVLYTPQKTLYSPTRAKACRRFLDVYMPFFVVKKKNL